VPASPVGRSPCRFQPAGSRNPLWGFGDPSRNRTPLSCRAKRKGKGSLRISRRMLSLSLPTCWELESLAGSEAFLVIPAGIEDDERTQEPRRITHSQAVITRPLAWSLTGSCSALYVCPNSDTKRGFSGIRYAGVGEAKAIQPQHTPLSIDAFARVKLTAEGRATARSVWRLWKVGALRGQSPAGAGCCVNRSRGCVNRRLLLVAATRNTKRTTANQQDEASQHSPR
jgi:hypothetical protein